MPRFLNTKGQPTLGIAICSRCQTKRMLADLVDDGNIRNFKVCRPNLSKGCWDHFDPFRLPAPPPDKMNLPFVRPDVDVAFYPNGLPPLLPPLQDDGISAGITGVRVTGEGNIRITEEGDIRVVDTGD